MFANLRTCLWSWKPALFIFGNQNRSDSGIVKASLDTIHPRFRTNNRKNRVMFILCMGNSLSLDFFSFLHFFSSEILCLYLSSRIIPPFGLDCLDFEQNIVNYSFRFLRENDEKSISIQVKCCKPNVYSNIESAKWKKFLIFTEIRIKPNSGFIWINADIEYIPWIARQNTSHQICVVVRIESPRPKNFWFSTQRSRWFGDFWVRCNRWLNFSTFFGIRSMKSQMNYLPSALPPSLLQWIIKNVFLFIVSFTGRQWKRSGTRHRWMHGKLMRTKRAKSKRGMLFPSNKT